MSLEAAITFTLAIFIFGITPGPGIFAILARALNSGAKSCIPLSLGMSVSDVIYLILATFGLAAIAENYGGLFTAIRFIGAAYLMYLGWKMWTTKVDVEIQKNKVSRSSWLSSFVQGFLISASNPKVILFYIAFLPTFMDLTKLSTSDIVLVSGLTLLALMVGLMLVAVMASSVRKYLKSQKALKRLNKTAGSIMIGAGLFLVSRGTS
ncbi:LysE family translocator [Cocleimonas sp. KMM 6892]|jgi:threonine/homoserine/homoserine lactone efflux protein|uniref:LysE family translocator n=1 Tax=unclassified Cocleimonas TaxID=2639732 RepID=UPI002DBFA6AC|nr:MULTISPECIES: LysE family translocator [unclassified Cocleimonas]MEB8431362.1 LysE family translocator [Cocleimonas sp. KMM 6892]MEC4713866.1 LysE family translocator [Cocleimonas sp. KMM 6895]MEC4743197.1 LysE family translocator [Cocleimonas sp. KMM 6896]